MHGSTVATDTILEKKGAQVGLLTTAGFRDSLEIRRGIRYKSMPVLPLLDAGLIFIWDGQVELLAIAPRGHRSLEDARSDADGF